MLPRRPQDLAKELALRAIRHGVSLPNRPLQAFAEHQALRDVLRTGRIDVVLDVGANTGQFAAGLRAIGFAGSVISFEPVARDFAALSRRMANDPDWRGLQLALGDADATAEINVVPSLTVMNSILPSIDGGRPTETEIVTVRRLDTLISDLLANRPDARCLLKMDTQGFDLRCFAGASGCLDRVVALFSELSVLPLYQHAPHYLESLATYEAAGFDLLDLSVVSRRGHRIQEMNCVMQRREPAA